MGYQAFRKEFLHYYLHIANDRADAFCEKIFSILDEKCTSDMNGFQRKVLQYNTIADAFEPVLFENSPFYHEMGTMQALCDGAGDFHGMLHAGGWNYNRFSHLFAEQDPELWKLRQAQGKEQMYLICGPYSDTRQHFIFNMRPIFRGGLKALYEEALAQKENAGNDREKDFLNAACQGLLAMKRISEKFSIAAKSKLQECYPEGCPECPEKAAHYRNLVRMAESAARTPWNAPTSFYEALNMLAFFRTVPGALEGIGYNTLGRPDVELEPFYRHDLESGLLTKEEAYDLIMRFLLTWDCHYDHDMKMVGYADHELENTYTLGGCDAYGHPVWNDLTEMFIRATREEKIIFPKISIRFSANSPKEYLDAANLDVIHGTSSVLYQNDDASIPALTSAGFSLEDARNYVVTGCWELIPYGNLMDDEGNYVSLLKPFEYAIHNLQDKMEECGLTFHRVDDADSFEKVYRIVLENERILLKERNRMTLLGKKIWTDVDPLPLTSASMDGCLHSRRDGTEGGCKYHHETYTYAGFPDVLDSLLVIKTLCFDQRKISLKELLCAVRSNWEGYEELRELALHCPAWGDESEASCSLANRFNHDLQQLALELVPLWEGGRIDTGYLTYTEIRFWGEKTLAMPNGRRNGDYIAQGLTPSRLHRIKDIASVINSFEALDCTDMPGNSVVNIILPSSRMTLDNCEAYLRAMAHSSIQCLQLNCTTREDLLDAQIHPEKHQDLIVRVCGFSARFTALSPEWQQEVLTRNFYD